MYLSLIGKSIRLNDAFVELNRGLGVARLIFVPEVHIVKAEPLWIALIPLKLVQKGPSGVALHIHSIPDSCRLTTNKIQYNLWWFCDHLHTIKSFQTWLSCVEHKRKYFFVHTMKVNGVQYCFVPHWLPLYGQKQFKHSSKDILKSY